MKSSYEFFKIIRNKRFENFVLCDILILNFYNDRKNSIKNDKTLKLERRSDY